MGLDMYLYKEYYLSDYFDDENKSKRAVVSKLFDYEGKDGGVTVKFVAIYWRKTNSIHGWFVQNVQNGVDDCGTYYVSKENIKDLYDLVSEQLKDRKKELLNPVGGFFFGGDGKDEWFWKDLEWTKKELAKELKAIKANPQLCDYYYHSSW